jgi:hypothetical protein
MAEGRPVRSLSFTDGGGLVAVVHASAPQPVPARRRNRGGR